MTLRSKTALYWVAGILTAFAGVAVVRLLAPQFAGRTATYTAIAGHLLALAGLILIALGVRQRVWTQQNQINAADDSTQKNPNVS